MTQRRHDASDDARLSELLEQAVSDVEPREALPQIRTAVRAQDRTRNRTKVTRMSTRRPWSYAVGGAVVAVAAVAVAVSVGGDRLGLTSSDDRPLPAASHHRHQHSGTSSPGEAAGTTTAAEESTEPSGAASPSPATSPERTATAAVYYVGSTPAGQRLFREFTQVGADDDPVTRAVNDALGADHDPLDPDYSSPWPEDSSAQRVTLDGDSITVDLVGSRAIEERPAGLSATEAELALQQVVYTAQAGLQSRASVRFLVNEQPVNRVLGVDTSTPLGNDDPIKVLSLVSISDPVEGASVTGSFTATGVASSFEANVPWEIRQGDQVVAKGFATAEGWMDKLYPWKARIDVSRLAPGTYTFVARTDDPSAGEGKGPYADTRTIRVG